MATITSASLQPIVWNRLGTSISTVNGSSMLAKDALEAAGLNFTVGGADLYYAEPSLSDLLVPGTMVSADSIMEALHLFNGRKASVRTDNYTSFGIVGSEYGFYQNRDAFNWVDLFCSGEVGTTPVIVCAGCTNDGGRVFITAKFPTPVSIEGVDDEIEFYVVFSTSHDGSGSVRAIITPIRVACNNALNIALSSSYGKISWRHTNNIYNRLDLTLGNNARHAYDTLNLCKKYQEEFTAKVNAFARKSLSDQQIENVLVNTLLSEAGRAGYAASGINSEDISTIGRNTIENVMNSIHSGIGQDIISNKNSAWAVLNGITTYFQNNVSYKSDAKKFNDVLIGNVANRLQTAYKYIDAA